MVKRRLSWIVPFVLVGAPLAGGTHGVSHAGSQPQKTSQAAADAAVKHHGIDVSHHQGEIDWDAVRDAGTKFVFAKATEGSSWVDPKFADNWTGIKEAGLVRGAYHFFHPHVDAETQAAHFIATVQLEPGDLPPVLDIEVAEGVSVEGIDEKARVWLEKVTAACGVRPIIYSDLHFVEAALDSGFSAYPLWIAEYSATAPKAPGDWRAWTLWQHSQTGRVAGTDSFVDESVFHGAAADWEQLLVPEDRMK